MVYPAGGELYSVVAMPAMTFPHRCILAAGHLSSEVLLSIRKGQSWSNTRYYWNRHGPVSSSLSSNHSRHASLDITTPGPVRTIRTLLPFFLHHDFGIHQDVSPWRFALRLIPNKTRDDMSAHIDRSEIGTCLDPTVQPPTDRGQTNCSAPFYIRNQDANYSKIAVSFGEPFWWTNDST
jgi:hypothetical protein